MPVLPILDPPGNLNDITDLGLRRQWSERIARFFNQSIRDIHIPGTTPQFYNPLETDTTDPKPHLIEWNGFPKLVKDANPGDEEGALRQAEPTEREPERRIDFQDEYLEWNVVRNAEGKITRVSFTCEGPEYWEFLAEHVSDKLLELYRTLVNPTMSDQVRLEHLIVGGRYNPENQWNTLHGAVHLIQPNNNLYAEVHIAADATVLRQKHGQPVIDADALIKCGRFGEPGRSSDPLIGFNVQKLARTGAAITLRNPVALYITNYTSAGFTHDGAPVRDYWNVIRGQPKPATSDDPAQALHLVYEVPPGEGFVVGDIKIGPNNIAYGGQLAEFVKVGLTGLSCRENSIHNPAQECVGTALPHAPLAGMNFAARMARRAQMPRGKRMSRASKPMEE